jgi:hypothetical protein
VTATPDVLRALGALSEPPGPAHGRLADGLGLPARPRRMDYADVFLLQTYPYASIYVGAEGMIGGAAGDRVAGFWRAIGLTPPAEPDHLAALLGLMASLGDAARRERAPARRALLHEARRALLWEHLLSWVVPFARKVAAVTDGAYRAWAGLLGETLLAEADELGTPDALPLHLREAPQLPGADQGGDAFVRALLAPVRSGLILTRSDLVRAARELGIGLRIGERSFALRAMLDQDAPAVLDWLGSSAGDWARYHGRTEGSLGDVARFWRGRAEATRDVLRSAAGDLVPSGGGTGGR